MKLRKQLNNKVSNWKRFKSRIKFQKGNLRNLIVLKSRISKKNKKFNKLLKNSKMNIRQKNEFFYKQKPE